MAVSFLRYSSSRSREEDAAWTVMGGGYQDLESGGHAAALTPPATPSSSRFNTSSTVVPFRGASTWGMSCWYHGARAQLDQADRLWWHRGASSPSASSMSVASQKRVANAS